MAQKKYPEMPERIDVFIAAVESLKQQGGSATIEETEDDVAEILHLSEKARAIPHREGKGSQRTQSQYELARVHDGESRN
jgi:hypothetical protein